MSFAPFGCSGHMTHADNLTIPHLSVLVLNFLVTGSSLALHSPVLIIHSNIEWGPKMIQNNIQFEIKSEIFNQENIDSIFRQKSSIQNFILNKSKIIYLQTLSESL